MTDPNSGLPCNLDAERYVLGSVLVNNDRYPEVAARLRHDDFILEKHKRIFLRMGELHEAGVKIDRITLAEQLSRHKQLEACDGLGYLVSLDEGMPVLPNVEGYIRIVKEKSELRQMVFASQKVIDRCMIAEDTAKEIRSGLEEILFDEVREAGPGLEPAETIMENHPGGLDTLLNPRMKEHGLQTGLLRYDDMTGGFHPGELTILAARPSMGKTSWALNIAEHLAIKKEKRIAFFSMEMSKETLLHRLLCSMARVDGQRFRLGYTDQDDRLRLARAADRLASDQIWIDDSANLTSLDLHARVRKMRPPPDLIVIDYLQLMRGHKKHENRVQEVTALSRDLKNLAKHYERPVLALSQLSRAPESRKGDNRPQLSDLRESGAIEQDADVVVFIYREELYKPDREDVRGKAELIIRKQRNGPTGTVRAVFLHGLTRFENMISDIQPELSDGKERSAGE